MFMEKTDRLEPTPERIRKAEEYVEFAMLPDHEKRKIIGHRPGKIIDPIESLLGKERISLKQFQAGRKYYWDWYIGCQLSQRVTPKYTELTDHENYGESHQDAATRRAHLHKSYIKATDRLGSARLAMIARLLVLEDRQPGEPNTTLEEVGRYITGYKDKSMSIASAVSALIICLDILADHYGL